MIDTSKKKSRRWLSHQPVLKVTALKELDPQLLRMQKYLTLQIINIQYTKPHISKFYPKHRSHLVPFRSRLASVTEAAVNQEVTLWDLYLQHYYQWDYLSIRHLLVPSSYCSMQTAEVSNNGMHVTCLFHIWAHTASPPMANRQAAPLLCPQWRQSRSNLPLQSWETSGARELEPGKADHLVSTLGAAQKTFGSHDSTTDVSLKMLPDPLFLKTPEAVG